MQLGGKTDTEKLENLIKAVNGLKERVGIKKTIRDYGIDEQDFLNRLDDMTEQAFDDQCTGANPRYPLMSEIKQMYLNAYYGDRHFTEKPMPSPAAPDAHRDYKTAEQEELRKGEDMNLDRIIAVRNHKTVYRDGELCMKVFDETYSKADILAEALNQARVEETGLHIPQVREVTVIDGKWTIMTDYIKGKTLAQLMDRASRKEKRLAESVCRPSDWRYSPRPARFCRSCATKWTAKSA